MVTILPLILSISTITPPLALAISALLTERALRARAEPRPDRHWQRLLRLNTILLGCTLFSAVALISLTPTPPHPGLPGLRFDGLSAVASVLVQALSWIIAAYAQRYLEGEKKQLHFIATFTITIAAVHAFLLADNWLLLIGSWSLVCIALNRLLRFYPERFHARLATHKKQLPDRLADIVLAVAAWHAWQDSGTLSITAYLQAIPAIHPTGIDTVGICLAIAVILRMAQIPFHGWLITVMEAPTPVSALLHAGVVNLGGFLLIRFAPLLDASTVTAIVLSVFGLLTAVLAGFVSLTRVSIKVKLAWSTVAQMGFMVLECGLGLYTLALLHFIGHSLYKAHHFLASSTIVFETLRKHRLPTTGYLGWSLVAAPLAAWVLCFTATATMVAPAFDQINWPLWWTTIVAFAFSPFLWVPRPIGNGRQAVTILFRGSGLILGLVVLAHLGEWTIEQLALIDHPRSKIGWAAAAIMVVAYLLVARIQAHPRTTRHWWRWSYAGFYLDERFTRLALWLWPIDTDDRAFSAYHFPIQRYPVITSKEAGSRSTS